MLSFLSSLVLCQDSNMTYAEYTQVMRKEPIPSLRFITPTNHSFARSINDYMPNLVDNFKVMMQYSVASYCPSTTSKKTWNCGIRCEGATINTRLVASEHDASKGAAGYVGVNTDLKAIIVAFRGTSTVRAAIQDIKLFKTSPNLDSTDGLAFSKPDSNAKVHFGFKETYLAIRTGIQNGVRELMETYPDYPIYFTGHSLGGALATLASADFHESNPGNHDRISVYTFGQPRVGNEEWAQYFDSLPFSQRFFRITKNGDPVPHLPPISFSYLHSLQQYDISRSEGNTERCKTTGPAGESQPCLQDVLSLDVLQHIIGYYGWWSFPWFC